MKPLDPRLIRHARAARGYMILTAALGVAMSVAVVFQAMVVARVIGTLASGGRTGPGWLPRSLIMVAAIVAVRIGVAWAQERFAHRAAISTIAQLRGAVLRHVVALGPRFEAEGGAAKAAQLATRGLDALDAYFARYLPQLGMVVTVTPILLVVAGFVDWLSAVIMFLTVPLIPVFMVLIGRLTEAYSARRLRAMTHLGAQVMDLITGLPTLKALGREKGPAARVRELSQAHQKATFATVRIAFLSGAALELIATLSVALVAVSVGLRLQAGRMSLVSGLAIIMIAPEIYLPLRNVGAHFHASASGVAASNRAFDLLSLPLPEVGRLPAPDLSRAAVVFDAVSVRPPGRDYEAPAGLSFRLEPGSLTALSGPNGAGKSTAVSVLLGLTRPDRGRVLVEPADGGPAVDLSDADLAGWWDQIAWVPQRPVLLPGTVLENLLESYDQPGLGAEVPAALAAAAAAAGFDTVVDELPEGWQTRIGQGGVGLSVGQRQRLALARAFRRNKPLVILDEPTAHLDPATEAAILDSIALLHRQGRTVLLVAHRPALLGRADREVPVRSAAAPAGSAGSADQTGPAASAGRTGGAPFAVSAASAGRMGAAASAGLADESGPAASAGRTGAAASADSTDENGPAAPAGRTGAAP
ncbi:MAG: thiol reductant ABC exporter subunit CydD [Bifidobacteriaceae bacterium]|jgi:ATP-binding cassette subfamily C protein CydD|nr:thiol reductant ABC exporter subunit CydD [Bifidobacteriaceae bacterium]